MFAAVAAGIGRGENTPSSSVSGFSSEKREKSVFFSSLYRTPAVAVQVSVSLKSTCANAA